MTNLDTLKANLNYGAEATDAASTEPTAEVTPTAAPEPKVEATVFQHYASSRIAMRLVTTNGKKISFTNYQFITADPDIIDYLDAEIKAGINVITKGKAMTSEEADPMASLKRKHIAEYLEQQKEESAKAPRDFSGSEESSKINKINPMSTEGVVTA